MATRTQTKKTTVKKAPAVVGLEELVGHSVTLYCGVFIYTGTLVAVGPTAAKLADASIVFETGELTSRTWAIAEKLPTPHWWVMLAAVESFGPGK